MTKEEFIKIIEESINMIDYDVATDYELEGKIDYEPYLNNFNKAIRLVKMKENISPFKWLEINCTCTNCNKKNNCEFAFDEYCINGDCLAEK